MALSNTSNKTVFSCNGSTVNFDFDFKVFDEGDLEVILYTIADGTEETLVLGTDYSTSLLTELGGRITTVTAYSSAYKLIARRKQALTQEIDYTQNDIFSTENLEEQLDKMVMMIQDLQEQIDRAVKFDASIISAETVVNLPDVTATVTDIDINGLSEKTAPVDNDIFIIEDSEADYQQKKVKKTKVLVINTLTEKTTPADNDLILIEDSAASNVRKKLKKSNLVPLDTDGTLAANSDSKIATQKAGKTYTDAGLGTKQATLVSGTNIKTINSTTLLGSGDIATPSLSNVIFEWTGNELYGTTYGLNHNTTDLITSTGLVGYVYYENNGEVAQTILVSRFTKIAGISTVTIHARLWAGTTGTDEEAILTVDIGGHNNTVKSVTSTTPAWVTTSTIDVSALSNGTTYDITISLQTEKNTKFAFCSAVKLIGS